ncbi:AP-3 complex subunit sigma-2 isoform X2 [Anarhichas minor]|uniref:AP-3 complex subunit sigma-2 isoform X2 n=1 Tax=Anarhichas minor TaxID=65739 RepID=UPI003F73B748
MIKSILIFNNHGKPRLIRFYQYFAEEMQQQIIRETFHLVSKRDDNVCNFLEGGSLIGGSDDKLIYRHYATLYFVFCVDSSESELGILDLIQVFVETLDKCFENVCELDLIFHMDKVHYILQEVVMGGMVLETNMNEIVAQVELQNRMEKSEVAVQQPALKSHICEFAWRSVGGPRSRRLCREEHEPARDSPQHQHRRHQYQSAEPLPVLNGHPR